MPFFGTGALASASLRKFSGSATSAFNSAASERFLKFFAANIRYPNTCRAYARQVMQFLAWCRGYSVTKLEAIRLLHMLQSLFVVAITVT